ncbi:MULTISPECIES: type IV pilin protein [Lysobacter]|uniref:type IV pilin protein n=1 Tax=Lysobacter TaxID=68 RepID=UPI002286B4EF|nr:MULTISPECIES: type IV pilin protein [Lysobacter]
MSAYHAQIPARARYGRGRIAAGFTLIELMMAVAVVAILAAIAYPSYQDSVRKARRSQAKADLVELAQRAERYYTLNNSYAGFWASVPVGQKRSPRDGAVYYLFARTPNDSDVNAFILSATPTGTQTADTGCGTLTLNQAGAKTITGTMELSRCW